MYKVRYRKFKVGIDHTTLLVGSWTAETLEPQEHYCTYRMGFTECHSEAQQYQLPEKMFQEEGRLKTCCWVLGETEKGRQNQASSLWPGNSTPISLTHSHLRTPENDCWCYWTLLASASPNPGSWYLPQCLWWPPPGLFPWASVHFSSAVMIFITAALTEILTYHSRIASTGTQSINNTSCYKVSLSLF